MSQLSVLGKEGGAQAVRTLRRICLVAVVLVTAGCSSSSVSPSLAPLSGSSPTHAGAGGFTASGSMAVARAGHMAILLRDGRILVVGGMGESGEISPAELYDPTTGKFSPTGSLAIARQWATATLLQDGRVLIAGGHANTRYTESADLYNPATGEFSDTGLMTEGRGGHTATLLQDGRVLMTGGLGNHLGSDQALASAELYDPRTDTFSPTGAMVESRGSPTATLLSDGRVLIAGGADGASAELYDPRTGTFSPTGSMRDPRHGHTATLLADGRVLVAGGWQSSEIGFASAELYDPKSGSFAQTGSMSAARSGGSTATLLQDGRVLITGGETPGTGLSQASADVFDLATDRFTPTAPMQVARSYHTATLLPDGRVLVAGGYNGSATLASAELFQP